MEPKITAYRQEYRKWWDAGGTAIGPAPDPKAHGLTFGEAIAARDIELHGGRNA